MDLLIVVDLAVSYEVWKESFDEDAEARAEFSSSMVVGQTDEGKALVLAYGVDVPAMAAFMGTPEFAERTSGVHSGFTIYTLSEMALPG